MQQQMWEILVQSLFDPQSLTVSSYLLSLMEDSRVADGDYVSVSLLLILWCSVLRWQKCRCWRLFQGAADIFGWSWCFSLTRLVALVAYNFTIAFNPDVYATTYS